MPTAPPCPVNPRRDGDPTPDLLWLELSYRAGVHDLGRLTTLAENIAFGGTTPDRRRVRAFAGYLDDLRVSIVRLHRAEAEVIWPTLEAAICFRAAGRADTRLDLHGLEIARKSLDTRLDQLNARTAALRAGADNGYAVAGLALTLADLREAFCNQAANKQANALPAIRDYVSGSDWAVVSAAVRPGPVGFTLPRLLAVASTAESVHLQDGWSASRRLLVRLLSARHRRRERRIFGPAE
jgi:hypothetical protein